MIGIGMLLLLCAAGIGHIIKRNNDGKDKDDNDRFADFSPFRDVV